MYRITAINEETDTEDEDDTKVTKEAEETIVVSEYRRALQMEKENAIDDALFMFSEILETQVLYEVTRDHTDKTLISIKYNCLKNIGFIHNKKGEKKTALEYLLKAIELDDSDVFTLNLLGQTALQIQQLDVAQMAFEKCLKQNPNHWPSGDGILQILCMRENYNEAYGWALMWYDKNPNYTRGLDVILEIREKFQGLGLEYIENCWSIKFKNKSLRRTNKESVFPRSKTPELQMPDKPDIEDFKVESFASLNWLTFGEFIANVYDHLANINNGIGIGYEFSYNDFLLNKTKPKTPEPVTVEKDTPVEMDIETEVDNITESDVPMEMKPEPNSDSNGVSNNPEGGNSNDGGSTEDSTQDVPTNSEDSSKPNAKPKSRRRGSDLKLLEPWCYWDRNRKCSQRQKNKQIERLENDTSINGLLRKIMTKYFEDNFDGESPFHPNEFIRQDSTDSVIDDNGNYAANKCVTLESFQAATADAYSKLIKVFEENDFTVIDLVTEWSKCISKFWERKMPDEILDLYIKLYLHHTNHYDLSTWILLDENDYKAAFRMALFYLEISHQKAMQLSELNTQNEVDDKWFIIFNHLIFQSGFHDFDPIEADAIKYQKRVEWLQYCLARFMDIKQRSVNCLESIRYLCVAHDETHILFLPNNKLFNRIDMKTINESIVMLERTISLNNVKELYEKENYLEIIPIIKDSLNNSTKTKTSDDAVMKLSTQFEIILECFWNLEMFDDCLIWSERCLKYALDRFIGTSKDSPPYNEWSKNINFILTYIEALILNESYLIVNCLKKYYARLIQSIVRIVSNQLDTPQEKNSNPTHPIDIKMPWIILHHVLQREEDMKPHSKRKLSNDSNGLDEKDTVENETVDATDDTIPKSIAIFFTAHEYLGSRSWCTRDKGQLLLYVMKTIVPRLRTPALEAFRDIIAEYLEQVTYCLYGYPAKRPRLKHIEEHDAQNVDLEWNQAIQLYDLYRPDDLPEFDSYKNDSITSEMEQMLQRILAIIPPEMDSTAHATDMEKFIGGELDELPKPLDILPYRINSIYYLLADHYFKNRDFSKAVKYYVLDLIHCPTRFDAWAGLALSKASIMETKLNACSTIPTEEWIQQSEEVLRCFKQCFKIDSQILSLWIEYGNYAYALHSYCSRCLKQSSDTLSMEKFSFLEAKKEECLKIAHDCFTTTDQFKLNQSITEDSEKSKKSDDDEKWLYHYMLGKVAEKRKEAPNIVIDHYLKSAKYLYEHNATYPFKISFSNPQNLSLEALEIFYRITAAIIKYMEQHSVITRGIGRYFIKILKQQAKSPFAMNQAKINENSVNAFKRKLSLANEEAAKQKMAKLEENVTNTPKTDPTTSDAPEHSETTETLNEATKISTSINVESVETDDGIKMETELPTEIECKKESDNTKMVDEQEIDSIVKVESLPNPSIANIIDENVDSPLRRGSQESTATTTTQTTTTTGTGSSSSTSSDSDSTTTSSTEDDSSSEDDANKDDNAPLDEKNVDTIYKMCIKNLEECVTRFPEHYKSIYRLVMIYMNGPKKMRSEEKCNQLLLGTYTTELGNQIQGLFTDRKNNNLFNGIWRNPSSDIDRPGSFSSHLSKCVNILMQTLRLNADYKLFLEIIFHLMRVPDADKRYIKDSERKDLLEHAYSFCVQSFRDLLKRHSIDKPDDNEMLTLIVEIFKAHKKCFKNVVQKDSPFSGVLVESYKAYIQGKVDWLPDTVNYIELATKLCVHEINARKNQDKQHQQTGKRHSLDELGFGSLAASLSKLNNTYSGASGIGCTIQPVSTAVTSTVTVTTTTTETTTPNISTVVTTASISVPVTSTTTTSLSSQFIPGIPNRPRGRPPGSKNINVKTNEMKKQTMPTPSSATTSSISNVISYLLKPMEPSISGPPLPNLNLMTAHLEPSIKATVISLFKEQAFMKTLARFQDPPSMTIFLSEYFRYSNFPNIPQLMSAFMGVLNMLAASLQPSTSLPSSPNTQTPKMDVSSTMSSKSSAMSIFPVSSKPQSTLSSVPTKTKTSNATITPVTSPSALQSTSILKTNASTVLNVGSGQLTITPSISITPNIPPTSMNTPLMQMPNFAQGIPQIPPVKVKQKPGPKPGSKHISKTGLKPGPKAKNTTSPHQSIPIDLPKSLSIIQQSSAFIPPQLPALMGSEAFVGKVPKQSKPRKKSVDGNLKANAKTNIPQMKAPNFGRQSVVEQFESQILFNQYQELLRSNPNGPNFMAQFEQFLTGSVPPDLAKVPNKRTSTDSIAQPQKAGIKVKKLEQLQATSSTAKQSATSTITSKQRQKSNKPTFTSPPSGIVKNQPMTSNTAVLNAFGTTISSLPHLAEKIAHPYSAAMLSTPASLPAGLQISPTKSLQQKLAERQKQFSETNCPSRPSSTSSAGSAKTHKSDNNVIVLD